MKKTGIVLIVLAALFGFLVLSAYNNLVSANESVSSTWAQVENVLQRRYDLIPNLVNTVKGYAKHEKQLLEEVTRLRSQWGAAQSTPDRIRSAQGLESALSRLMVVMENYPQLKANENFMKLQDELAGTENRIAVERKRYNDAVREYNVLTRRFPSNMVAGWFGYAPKDDAYFEAASEAQAAPKVEF